MSDRQEQYPITPCPKCDSKETEKKDCYYEGMDLVEYSLHCAKCDTYLGYCSYGSWEY